MGHQQQKAPLISVLVFTSTNGNLEADPVCMGEKVPSMNRMSRGESNAAAFSVVVLCV